MYNKKIPLDTECGFRIALEVIGGKWKSYIVYELLEGPLRPAELMRRIPGVGERVFNQQLGELVDFGIIDRTIVSEGKKHTEYALTETGRSLIPVIEALRDWGNTFRPRYLDIVHSMTE